MNRASLPKNTTTDCYRHNFEAVEFATLERADRSNHRRDQEPTGNIPPAEAEEQYYATLDQAIVAAQLKPNDLQRNRPGSVLQETSFAKRMPSKLGFAARSPSPHNNHQYPTEGSMTLCGVSPRSSRAMFSAIWEAISRGFARPDMCGVTSMPGVLQSGEQAGRGSLVKTSRIAPRTCPDFTSSRRSSTTRCSPRLQRMSEASSGSIERCL